MKLLFVFLLSVLLMGCYRDPKYPVEPAIQWMGLVADSTPYLYPKEGYLRISFTDGDGDLGKLMNEDTINVKNIVVKNLKNLLLVDTLTLPIIPAKGDVAAISGTIDISLVSIMMGICETPLSKPLDTLSFEIKIKDRAGHWSNVITTPSLVLGCQ